MAATAVRRGGEDDTAIAIGGMFVLLLSIAALVCLAFCISWHWSMWRHKADLQPYMTSVLSGRPVQVGGDDSYNLLYWSPDGYDLNCTASSGTLKVVGRDGETVTFGIQAEIARTDVALFMVSETCPAVSLFRLSGSAAKFRIEQMAYILKRRVDAEQARVIEEERQNHAARLMGGQS